MTLDYAGPADQKIRNRRTELVRTFLWLAAEVAMSLIGWVIVTAIALWMFGMMLDE